MKDVVGTKISLADGSYDSKYTKIDSEGKISCKYFSLSGSYSSDSIIIFSGTGINTQTVITPSGFGVYRKNTNGELVQTNWFDADDDVPNISLSSPDRLNNAYLNSSEMRIKHNNYDIYRIWNNAGVAKLQMDSTTNNDVESILEPGRLTVRTTNTSWVNIKNGDVTTGTGASLNSLASSLGNKQPQGNVSSLYPQSSVGHLNNFYSGVALGSGIPGAPNAGWFMVVAAGTAGTTVQRAYELFQGSCYHRYCASGTWSGWKCIY